MELMKQGQTLERIRLCLVPIKYQEKKKYAKKNNFLMFGFIMKNTKSNQI